MYKSSHHLHVVDLGFKLQTLLLQEVQFVGAGPGRVQLLLQHALGLQQDLVVLLQLLQKHRDNREKQLNINTAASARKYLYILLILSVL